MDDVDIQGEVASGVLALFNNISDFIYKLINTGTQAASESASASASASESASASSSEAATADNCRLEIDSNKVVAEPKYWVYYTIKNNIYFLLNIPARFTLDSNGLVQLDNNLLLVEAFNEKNKEQISLIQYYRFNTKTQVNCVVIHLIIKMGDDDDSDTKNVKNVYICVEYDTDGKIKDSENACVYDIFNNYSKSKFGGVAPNLNNRNLRNNYQYLFSIQYEQMIENARSSALTKPHPAKPTTPSSQLSPAQTFTTQYSNLPVSTRMYSMYTHGVEGLGKIAEKRYSLHNSEINKLATENIGITGTIKQQLDTLSIDKKEIIDNDIKLAQAVNDLIDVAHDFGKIPYLDMVIDDIYFNESDDFKNKLKEKLNGLLSSPSGNIIVDKSHELQKDNIVQLTKTLRKNGIIFPDIPAEKYLSRMQVFAEFIADMMSNPRLLRSNYSDSGKQVTIGTFKIYYRLLDEGDKILFNERVMRIIGAGAGAMDDVIREKPDTHPSILKKIGLDGCSGKENATIDVSANISDVYGIFNVDISGNNNKGFNITIKRADNKLLEWSVPANFHITYDDIAKYIKDKYQEDFGLRGGDDKPYKPQYNTIQLFNEEKMSKRLKILLLQCLKTFCDKIYRTSMKDTHTEYDIEDGVTHVYTTDSYFYGDIILQYLAGLAEYIPTTLRAGEQRSGDESLVAENKDDAECNDDPNTGRGFYTNPGVDSSSYVDKKYADILRKTLGYASILQNLANECCVQMVYTSGSGSESDSDSGSGSGSPRSTKAPITDVFNLRNLLVDNGKLFDISAGKLGSLIDENIHSYRLINFVNRFTLNYNPDYKKPVNIQKYEDIINWLFQLECNKVIENVNNYVTKLKDIMVLDIGADIKNAIIQLPDLEDLLTMSTPAFCYENDDTLLLVPDTFVVEYGNGLFDYSSDETNSRDTSNVEVSMEKQDDPSFESLTFSLNDLTITGVNLPFKKMQKNQLVREYIITGNDITGPITLDLLYALKKLAPNNTIISNKINEILADFCSSCGLKCKDDDVATQGAKTGMRIFSGMTLTQAAAAAQQEELEAKKQTALDVGKIAKEMNYRNREAQSEANTLARARFITAEDNAKEIQQNEEIAARERQRKESQDRGYSAGIKTKRGGPGGGSRKRKPSKIPRQTIRRRAPRRAQKRTQKRKQKPRHTIRRQGRNNKGTQKRRK